MAEIIAPQRREEWIDKSGTLTLRATRFLESLTDTTNTVVIRTEVIETELAEDTGIGSLNAQVLRLQKIIGSGNPITIDTTGFTIDNTKQTIDRTEV